MGYSGNSIRQGLALALQHGNFKLAMREAMHVPHLDLSETLSLTLLAAEAQDPRADLMAQRWLVKAIAELRLTLEDVGTLAMQLRGVQMGINDGAGVQALIGERGFRH